MSDNQSDIIIFQKKKTNKTLTFQLTLSTFTYLNKLRLRNQFLITLQ